MQPRGRTALVGVDFSGTGDEALRSGLELLDLGAMDALHVAYVLDPRDIVPDGEQPVLVTEEHVLERVPELLRARVSEVALREGVSVDFERIHVHARIGPAVEALLQLCVDYDVELLIVGTNGRRGVDRLLLGSVAESLVRKARCRVLVARATDYAGLEKTRRPDPPYAPGEAPPATAPPAAEPVLSTERGSWHPSDNGPTGFRIV